MRGYEVVFPANFFLVATARRSFPLPLLFLLHEFAQRLLSPVPPIRIRVHARFVPPHPLLVLLPCRTSTHLSSTLILAFPVGCGGVRIGLGACVTVTAGTIGIDGGISGIECGDRAALRCTSSHQQLFERIHQCGTLYPSLSSFPELSNRPSQAVQRLPCKQLPLPPPPLSLSSCSEPCPADPGSDS